MHLLQLVPPTSGLLVATKRQVLLRLLRADTYLLVSFLCSSSLICNSRPFLISQSNHIWTGLFWILVMLAGGFQVISCSTCGIYSTWHHSPLPHSANSGFTPRASSLSLSHNSMPDASMAREPESNKDIWIKYLSTPIDLQWCTSKLSFCPYTVCRPPPRRCFSGIWGQGLHISNHYLLGKKKFKNSEMVSQLLEVNKGYVMRPLESS